MNGPTQDASNVASLRSLTAEIRMLREELADLYATRSPEAAASKDATASDLKSAIAGLRHHITTVGRDTVRQTEAMWQLLARTPDLRAPMPPSGGFPMEARSLLHLSFLLEELKPARILELGGGTSTIWMGYLTEVYGSQITSIDHLEDYDRITREHVERHSLEARIDCRLAPLEGVTIGEEQFKWYDPAVFDDIEDVDLLVVDGPPQAIGYGARYPALPQLESRLATGAVVVLDDCHRKDERATLRKWLTSRHGFRISDPEVSRLGVLRTDVQAP